MKSHVFGVLAIVSASTAACSAADDIDTLQQAVEPADRNFQAMPEGNGELNVIGCDLIEEKGGDTDVGFKPCVKTWMYGDLSGLKEPGDIATGFTVLSQVKDKDLPPVLGLIKFNDWSVELVRSEDGRDMLSVSGLGFKKGETQRHMENRVPFYEGLHETTFTTSAPDDPSDLARKQFFIMTCEVSFQRR